MSSSTPLLGESSSLPPWLELPQEITATILYKLGTIEIMATAEKVCPKWRSVCQDASMWRSIDMRGADNSFNPKYDFDKMCRHAVDRSQGQLNDISIKYFGSDDLLLYISERSKQLKRLELIYCNMISGEALMEVVKKLPLLEELHLYYTYVGVEVIEVIGSSCPNLKSFKFNQYVGRSQQVHEMEAFAVEQNMHELRHLQLFGHKMTNKGLQAILDGCPHLESLDLRYCLRVHLFGDLGRLCSQRIKDLRCPHDPIDDYDFFVQHYVHDQMIQILDDNESDDDVDLFEYDSDSLSQ